MKLVEEEKKRQEEKDRQQLDQQKQQQEEEAKRKREIEQVLARSTTNGVVSDFSCDSQDPSFEEMHIYSGYPSGLWTDYPFWWKR